MGIAERAPIHRREVARIIATVMSGIRPAFKLCSEFDFSVMPKPKHVQKFNVLDRVVCVRDDFLPEDVFLFSPELPKRGQIYVVREFRMTHGIAGVLLVGITGRLCAESGGEYGFKAERFRRIVEADVEAELTCELAL